MKIEFKPITLFNHFFNIIFLNNSRQQKKVCLTPGIISTGDCLRWPNENECRRSQINANLIPFQRGSWKKSHETKAV